MSPTDPRPSLRTCVGCRGRAPRSELLRVVAVEGALMPDPARRLPGRGAHLHRTEHCLALAERRRSWPRAFRVPGPLDATAVRDLLEPTPEAGPHRSDEKDDHRPMSSR